jgi:hypothetical protein
VKNLASALMEFQAAVGPVFEDETNPHFKSRFASLASIMSTIRPHLRQHGLSVMQFPISAGDSAGCRTIVMHQSGESLEQEFLVPIGAKVDPQKCIAAVSYARRACITGALALVTSSDLDRDGEDLVERPAPLKPPRTPQAATKRASKAKPEALGPAMSADNRKKVKHAAITRLKSLGVEPSAEEAIKLITEFALTQNATPKTMTDDMLAAAIGWIQEYQP